ncbi:hypothetical protein P3T20_005405 [Paraburkholderia sp. GAS206C]|jgi:hypothetical protein
MFRLNPFPQACVPDASPDPDLTPACRGQIFAECRL